MTFPFECVRREDPAGPLRFRSHDRVLQPGTSASVARDLSAEVEQMRATMLLAEQQHMAELSLAREQAVAQTRAAMQEEFEQRCAEIGARVEQALEAFDDQRKRYFADAEAEVVKLALAVARRVLHREAKLDPLLLRGVVRVAVEQMNADDEVRLRVPLTDAALWKETLHDEQVQVEGDAAMKPGSCELLARCGSVDLGVEAQLTEIETSFCELLGKRPQ